MEQIVQTSDIDKKDEFTAVDMDKEDDYQVDYDQYYSICNKTYILRWRDYCIALFVKLICVIALIMIIWTIQCGKTVHIEDPVLGTIPHTTWDNMTVCFNPGAA